MERVSKKIRKINVFSSIPRDVWRFLLLPKMYNIKTIGLLAQTCRAGRGVMEQLRTNNLYIAKLYRRKRQFPLALKCLQSCVDHGDKEAMFHLAFAYLHGYEWGIDNVDERKAFKLFKSISNEPFSFGRPFYALCLIKGIGCKQSVKEGFSIAQELLRNNDKDFDPFLRGICLYYRMGIRKRREHIREASSEFKKSLKYFNEENEYTQYYLGSCFDRMFYATFVTNRTRLRYHRKTIYYYEKAAVCGMQIARQSLHNCHGPSDEEMIDERDDPVEQYNWIMILSSSLVYFFVYILFYYVQTI